MQDRPTLIRYWIVVGVIILLAVIITIRFGVVMLGESESPSNFFAQKTERGPIFDRHGRVLAIQIELDSVVAWTPDIVDKEETARTLAPILDLEAAYLEDRFATQSKFLILKRTVSPRISEQIESLKQQGELQGIILQADVGRNYPERKLASSIIGYAGVDNVGLAGIEYTFDDYLSSSSENGNGSIAFGNQIYLTLDINIQYIAETFAQQAYEDNDASSAMIVVMDAKNGDVLAAASHPGFDPNLFNLYSDEERRNRIISTIYEPGSVFKIFSISSFLELGGITLNDYFQTADGYVNRDQDFQISDLGNYGLLNAEGIIKFSSNVGAAFAAERVNERQFHQSLHNFGFGEKTGIALNGEERGLLQDIDQWSGRTAQTIAIGQEIGVTAIQIVSAATALANEGMLLKPHIVDRIVTPSGAVIEEFDRESVRQVISPQNARLMLDMMHTATEEQGTARRTYIEDFKVSAKTGTAERYDPAIGGYSTTDFFASCLIIAPTDDPQIIIYTIIENPRGDSSYGGVLAAPVAREVLEQLITYLKLPRENDIVVDHSGRITPQQLTLPEFDTTLPDFRGISKKNLLPLLAHPELQVQIIGNGWVYRQTPQPGTEIYPDMLLRLELE